MENVVEAARAGFGDAEQAIRPLTRLKTGPVRWPASAKLPQSVWMEGGNAHEE